MEHPRLESLPAFGKLEAGDRALFRRRYETLLPGQQLRRRRILAGLSRLPDREAERRRIEQKRERAAGASRLTHDLAIYHLLGPAEARAFYELARKFTKAFEQGKPVAWGKARSLIAIDAGVSMRTFDAMTAIGRREGWFEAERHAPRRGPTGAFCQTPTLYKPRRVMWEAVAVLVAGDRKAAGGIEKEAGARRRDETRRRRRSLAAAADGPRCRTTRPGGGARHAAGLQKVARTGCTRNSKNPCTPVRGTAPAHERNDAKPAPALAMRNAARPSAASRSGPRPLPPAPGTGAAQGRGYDDDRKKEGREAGPIATPEAAMRKASGPDRDHGRRTAEGDRGGGRTGPGIGTRPERTDDPGVGVERMRRMAWQALMRLAATDAASEAMTARPATPGIDAGTKPAPAIPATPADWLRAAEDVRRRCLPELSPQDLERAVRRRGAWAALALAYAVAMKDRARSPAGLFHWTCWRAPEAVEDAEDWIMAGLREVGLWDAVPGYGLAP